MKLNEVGEDLKLMAMREDSGVKATVAFAVIASRVGDRKEYDNILEKTNKRLEKY